MNFAGMERVSLVDYPGKVALTLFTSSCNFDCAYCHNPELKKSVEEKVGESEVFKYLDRRAALIDAVVITGGEPTLRADDLIPFVERLKAQFPTVLVKLDTNGWNSDILREFLNVIDYVAVDLKSLNYEPFSTVNLKQIQKSIELAKTFSTHEIRITMFPPYVPEKDFEELARICSGASLVSIQQYRPVSGFCESPPYPDSVLSEFADSLSEYVKNVSVRK
ncbi:anaerobic ribonucleoside-triphosphate reductase activating protein [Mesotoga sp. UBA5847]|jgi:pyruvate formate lyase activating enzyme|uniref:anaerobic ribonucleoside-triphosphate reductase activating protein n=1 Tax=Mesotoga sp. UBA5847 TaxID=1946859 RepID=UPI001BD453BA|nr:anaerobic ribonucleoside-triphosphate reductase activating protein [Mesotoga sp. UBA5847]